MTARRAVTVLYASAVLAASCSGAGVDTTTTASVASTSGSETVTTSASPTTSASMTESTTSTSEAETEIRIQRNIPYVVVGSRTLTMDVYEPASDGTHPVLIAYHGGTQPNKAAMDALGSAAAEAGILTYAPAWAGLAQRTPEDWTAFVEQSACSAWAAVADAAERGADLDRITLFGISAGAQKAAAVGIYPSSTHQGCLFEPTSIDARQIILHESSFGLHGVSDQVFAANEGLFAEAALFGHIAEPTEAYVRFLVDTVTRDDPRYDGSNFLEPPATIESSLNMRDPALVEDFQRLGLIDDERLNITEVAVVLEDRMKAAGWDVDLTWITDSSHTVSRSVIDFVIESVLNE